MLVLIIFYALFIALLPPLPLNGILAIHFVHALSWCLFHCFGLGLLLRAQSKSKYIVRHFLKNYHYPYNDVGNGAVVEAFTNWKAIYNLSMCMTYSGFVYY
jgi:phosphatidylethanolamine N-methyltransferase